jgi:hypothetical protein
MSSFFGVVGTASAGVAVWNERRMQRHRHPGISYAAVTWRRDGGWRRADLFTPEGLRYQARASRFGLTALGLWMLALLMLAACLPIPERVYDTPDVAVQVLAAGAPVIGDSIILADPSADGTCVNPVLSAGGRTDDQGRFQFTAQSHRDRVTTVPAYHNQTWNGFLRATAPCRYL